MPVVNGVVVAPVDLETAVGQALGLGKPFDCGTLCSNGHGKINMWSKYKPVKSPNVGVLTAAQFKSLKYGIFMPSFVYSNPSNGTPWEYQLPTGGAVSPYRITDFNGYSHTAVPPLQINLPDKLYIGDHPYSRYVDFYFHEFSSYEWNADTCMDLWDIIGDAYLDYYYFAIMVHNESRGWKFFAFDTVPIRNYQGAWDPAISILIPTNWINAGNIVTIYAFLCLDGVMNSDGTLNGTISLEYLPGVHKKTYTAQTYTPPAPPVQQTVTWEVTMNTYTGKLFTVQSVRITITNNGTAAYTGALTLTGDLYDPKDTTEDSHNMGTVTVNVPVNATATYTIPLSNNTFESAFTDGNMITLILYKGTTYVSGYEIALNGGIE